MCQNTNPGPWTKIIRNRGPRGSVSTFSGSTFSRLIRVSG